ncbi:hypothetical protein pb186bvf_001772 [Paramecium bursaria]
MIKAYNSIELKHQNLMKLSSKNTQVLRIHSIHKQFLILCNNIRGFTIQMQ